jgi:hypothetical protein
VGLGMAGERRRTEDGGRRVQRGAFHIRQVRSGQVCSRFCADLVRRRASTRTQRRKEVARHTGTGHSAGGIGIGGGVVVVLVLAQKHGKEGEESREQSKAKRPACEGTGAQRTATMLVALSIIHDFSSSHICLVSSRLAVAVAVACWPVCVCVCVCVCGPLATSKCKCNVMY